MIKFRCPHCQASLAAEEAGKFQCPDCKQWSRIPEPKKKAAPVKEEILDVVEVPEPARPRREAVTAGGPRGGRRPDSSAEVEPVELELADEPDEVRPRRKSKPRRRRRRSSDGDSALDSITSSISVPIVMLIILAPLGLLIIVGSFFTHPIAGFASFFMVSGWIWFVLIASEDGIGTALMVMFVPFYALYYATQNWDTVAIPFLLLVLGNLGMGVGGALAGKNAGGGRRMEGPPAIVRPVEYASHAAHRAA